jgi:GT2 family glycosyltransferase
MRSPVRNMALQRNEGIRRARGEIVCFLDDDTYVQPGWWPAMVTPFLETPDSVRELGGRSPAFHPVGAVAGAVWCNPKPVLTDRRGGYVNWRGEPIQVTHRSAAAPREVDWTIGCNMAFRKSAAEAIGGLAEVFGIYDEDVDFGLRLRRAGWRIVYQPEAAVHHYFTSRPRPPQTKTTRFRDGRNRTMLLVRNYGLSTRLAVFLATAPVIQLWQAVRQMAGSIVQAAGHLAAYLAGMARGVVDGVRHPVSDDRRRYDEHTIAKGAETAEKSR